MNQSALVLGTGLVLALAWPMAHGNVASTKEIADLSLEELAGIEVTSVSRRGEPLSSAPASIYVITADAIRRAGASSLPEALRLAPNLQVARIDATQYAISARGFNNAIGNKLLVLIDGRTVYAPFFSGVLWDQQDVMLDDVERIEVISGPGATLWGANAVNGVINIISRSSADTQGVLVVANGGNRERGMAMRYGAAWGDAGHVRVYAKTAKLKNTDTESGSAVPDGNERHQIGFRADWGASADSLTLQGDTYRTHAEHRGFFGPFELTPITSSGANLLGRWTRHLDTGADLRVQAYVDHSERDDAFLYKPSVDLADLEFQHGLSFGEHKLVWGGGYRRAHDDIEPGVFFGFVPASRTLSWTNLFVQDDLALAEGLDLTMGLKLEHNDYTGTETLPNLRLAWQPGAGQLVWGALSRAVRAPARLDRDIRLPPAGPPYIIAGGPDFISEVANVFELGYRAQPSANWSYSATAFWHDWHGLRSGQTPPNAQVQNMIDGQTWGVEAWATWQAMPAWRLSAGLSTLKKDLKLQAGSTDPDGPANLGDDPDYQWSLRSAVNVAEGQDFDVSLRRVASLPQANVPAYTAVDARYGWRITRDVELALTAQNLFDNAHPEFGTSPGRSEIGRSVAVWLRFSL
ncbi:MAG: TonB-dependent receptor [Rhizobacter sp.]